MRRCLIALVLVGLAGCAKKDDADKLKDALKSWSATLQFVADARLRDEVRAKFGVKTAAAAVEELSGDAAKPSLPRPLTIRAERVIGIGAKLQDAFEKDDRAGIAAARRELASISAEPQ
jgi:hypothetical protein